MKRQIVILCCAAAAFTGCQQAEDGTEGSGTTVTEPSGAERPMRDSTNDTSGVQATNESTLSPTNGAGTSGAP